LRRLEIPPPFYVFPSLLNIAGYKLVQLSYQGDPDVERPLSATHLILPEVVVDDYDGAELDQLFRPAFDVLWNAGGWPQSINYDNNANYVPDWRKLLRH
jgi:hypothetical protein